MLTYPTRPEVHLTSADLDRLRADAGQFRRLVRAAEAAGLSAFEVIAALEIVAATRPPDSAAPPARRH